MSSSEVSDCDRCGRTEDMAVANNWWDHSPEAVAQMDCTHQTLVKANRKFELSVVSMSQVSSLDFVANHIHAEDQARFQVAIESVKERGNDPDFTPVLHNCKTLVLAEDNKAFPKYVKFDWMLMWSGGYVFLSGRKVTIVRDHQKDAVLEFEDFFQKAPIALHWLSSTGHVLWANETELNTLGYTADEYIGQPIMKFCPDDEDLVLEIFKTLGSGNTIKDCPVRFRTKTGEIRDLLVDSNVNWNADKSFNHTRCFIRDDTKRKVQQARLEAEVEAKTSSIEQRDRFVSKLFHELRTPCHVQTMALRALSDSLPPGSDLLPQLEQAITQALHISTLADDVKWVMLFDEGKAPELHSEVFHIMDLVNDITSYVQAIKDVHNHMDLNILVDVQPDVPLQPMKGFHEALTRVLTHLMVNGIKFSEYGFVNLNVSMASSSCNGTLNTVEEDDGEVWEDIRLKFSVRSTSTCIPEDRIHSLWREYWQDYDRQYSSSSVEASLIENPKGGLGLGLNIAFNLVQLMGEELNVRSTPSSLTEFWFCFPVRVHAKSHSLSNTEQASFPGTGYIQDTSLPTALCSTAWDDSTVLRQPSQPKERKDRSLLACLLKPFASKRSHKLVPVNETKWTSVNLCTVAHQHVAPDQATSIPHVIDQGPRLNPLVGLQPEPRAHILVVDDNTICQRVVSATLKSLNITCDTASNGKIACDMLKSRSAIYDTVLMDLRMPIMDGITATKHIRTKLKLNIPIIAFTAEDSLNTQAEVLAAGANLLLSKPVTKDTLLTGFKGVGVWESGASS